MSAVLQKSGHGSYQRVLHGKKAPEARISTADGITTLVSGNTSSGTTTDAISETKGKVCAQREQFHLEDKAINGAVKIGKRDRKRGATSLQSHGDRIKGTTASSDKTKTLSHLQKPQSFSGLGRVL
ncbi:Hypothetical protein GLP15_3471 [Giardia lamblia P15]|uniref:Uncharacterized protein n=1 Tax=Giardia intestinalis (strain P15) TaxID=658858 RepID=E1F0E2_GIAIA|nr:Hypothetical protein GLP15_3471 [Giardia lamblia P15]